MNDLEVQLAAALTAAADDSTAQMDDAAGLADLRARLDAVEGSRQGRRVWGLVLMAAAAAAVVAGLLVVAATSRSTAPPAGVPTPTRSAATWTGGGDLLTRPQLAVPGWAVLQPPLVAPRRFVRWQVDDRSLSVLLPATAMVDGRTSKPLTPGTYRGSLDSLRGTPGVQMSEWSVQPSGAGAADVVAVNASSDVIDALGCEQFGDSPGGCRALVGGARTVVAVIDAGHAPLAVIDARPLGDAVAAAEQDAEVAAVLASLRLRGLPVSCTGQIGPPEQAGCLGDLRAWVARDAVARARGDAVTRADYAAALAPWQALLESPSADLPPFRHDVLGDEPGRSTPTSPLLTRWTLGDTIEKTYVCFSGPTIEVSTDDCR